MTHTIESLKDKTPEELNVQLAELLGFVRSTTHKFSLYGLCEVDQEATDPVPAFTKDGRWYRPNTLPPYATSYDAIMPCVKALTDKQTFAFIEHLRVIRNIQATGDFAFTWLMMTSSEADLTRALILVLQNK